MLDRQQALNKKGTLTDGEIKLLVKEWRDKRAEEDLNALTVSMEMKAMEKKLMKYNVEQLGRHHESFSQPNGWLCKYGNERDKKSSNGMAHLQVRHKHLCIYGTQLQLVGGKLIGKSSIMVPRRREGITLGYRS